MFIDLRYLVFNYFRYYVLNGFQVAISNQMSWHLMEMKRKFDGVRLR